MKDETDTITPELPLDCPPVFDLDVERGDAWPLPEPRRFEPKPTRTMREVFSEMMERAGL